MTRLRERIRQAYYRAAGGQFSARALLRDVRSLLSDIDRDMLDRELLQMERERQALLYPLGYIEITPEDETAAIHIGFPRHILWIEQ